MPFCMAEFWDTCHDNEFELRTDNAIIMDSKLSLKTFHVPFQFDKTGFHTHPEIVFMPQSHYFSFFINIHNTNYINCGFQF